MKGISRVDSTRAKGWLVRVYHQGETHSKFFSDGRYGGRGKALQLAIDKRRELCEQLGLPAAMEAPPPLPFQTRPGPKNRTGVVGVCETIDRGRGGVLKCFLVTYYLNGRPGNKRFYHHLFDSREEAFAAAVKYRKTIEAQLRRQHRQRVREWKRRRRSRRAHAGD